MWNKVGHELLRWTPLVGVLGLYASIAITYFSENDM